MRLHHLELTAFGPFPTTERVDFDALAEAGLFLLTGHTGAGKTMLLDAVCFALFGSVPCVREQAGRLRSDHAEPGTAPRVELELTVAGRRLRVVRTPTWWSPRKRGVGDPIKQQPTAALAERVDGVWEPLSSRIPEVAHQVQAMLGMDVHQFTQVAMLPQGQFADFLRAGAEDRKKVLERLFATQRFRSVEQWLVEHRRACRTRAQTALDLVRRSVHQAAGAAGVEVPADDPDTWAAWLAATQTALDGAHNEAVAAEEAAAKAQQATRAALEDATNLRTMRATARQVFTDDERLRATESRVDADRLRLDAAERAAPMAGHLERCDTAATFLELRQTATEEARRRAAMLDLVVPEPTAPCGAQVTAAEEVALVSRLQAEEAARLRTMVAEHTTAEHQLEQAREQLDDAQSTAEQIATRLAHAPVRRVELDRLLTLARLTGSQQERWSVELARASEVRDAAAALPGAQHELQRLIELRNEADAELNRRVARVNDVVRARLEGAAVQLAAALVDGEDCPVCGSLEHPRPHRPISQHPTDADEQAARRDVQVGKAAAEAAELMCLTARESVTHLEAMSGGLGPDDADTARTLAEVELGTAHAALERAACLQEEIAGLDEVLVHDRSRQHAATAHASTLAERLRGLEQQHARRKARLVEALGPELDLSAHLRRVNDAAEAARELVRSLGALDAATAERLSAHAAAQQSAAAAGFDDVQQVRAATSTVADRSALREQLQQRQVERARIDELLADPELTASLERPEPPVGELTTRLAEQSATTARATRTTSVLRVRRQDVARLSQDAGSAHHAWLPLQRTAAVADAIAALAEGKSADNHLQVSLSAFVLAARLRQVVEAANERFSPMSSGRYSLEHTMARPTGDRRSGGGGLGLLVRDQWTGQTRDPRTLSGGETFWASLSLALGLSDVVSHEAGGVELHTLFVDEGFGSLDAEALDDVMDVLDGLRSNGRTVGVVSHVETMRERIPTQVRVTKGRSGSTVVQT